MPLNRNQSEVQGAIDRLRAGGRLLVIEEKPYPSPHKVVVVLGGEQYAISYNDFAFLTIHNIIRYTGATVFAGYPAEEYTTADT